MEGTEGVARLVPPERKGKIDSPPIAIARMAHTDDLANIAVFMFSDAASYVSYVYCTSFLADACHR